MASQIITPGPYRATKLWNEVIRLFRAGMPVGKHRQNLRNHSACFTASAAVNWLHQLLRSNSNFGPDVTRQQTVQLLKKFLKNHVIEDVKGRWGSEDLEDNGTLYRFPSSSPLKPLPRPGATASKSLRKRPSLRDKDGFLRFRSSKKIDKEARENVEPVKQAEDGSQTLEQRRELTAADEQEIWRDVTLTHLQRVLGVASLEEVLDPRHINPLNIIHNMTRVNKHGVVSLDNKTADDLPHWVLSAMKSLANWPKFDSEQPSYPGFERDVFRTVSDYFYSLPWPLLTFELYELFINVLGKCAARSNVFVSPTNLSPACSACIDTSSLHCLFFPSSVSVLCGYVVVPATHQLGKRKRPGPGPAELPAKALFRSTECLLLSLLRQGSCDETESPMTDVLGGKLESRRAMMHGCRITRARSCSLETVLDGPAPLTRQRLFMSRRSTGSCIDITMETGKGVRKTCRRSRVISGTDVRTPVSQRDSCVSSPKPKGLKAISTSNLWTGPHDIPATRRCLSSLDVSLHPPAHKPSAQVPHSLLQPDCERRAVEALQLCTLLLPPSSRRKLQLLMRMISRISQNVDMPRLHPAIGTRTLMVHTFSGCVLASADECDLDELLATRLVSFLMDHQDQILTVPQYLLTAISDHVSYLRSSQVPLDGLPEERGGAPLPVYTFCRQISGAEFEQQKLLTSRQAMEELLEILLTDQNLSDRDRRKKLKQFQKQYPDIYSSRVPAPPTHNKPKIKAPLINITRTKVLSLRS
ncbi:DEP domain-containing protein 1A isoform X3 [Synchiropus splendidus]|uniref:DEP domain-containing protein 1A isoform X3 n=1 Tax=Synchiropus splendidus TaxID=270530 RepID=UPI00237D6CF6|nr:DEP domain-containing protein 1A isoform X3 [Synchiropus splendidus]